MSSVMSPAHNQSTQASIAEVHVTFGKWLQFKIISAPVAAQVFMSSRIYWEPVRNCSNSTTLSLSDLRNVNSLEVRRFNGGTWQAVDKVVKKTEHERKASVLVCGNMHGPLHRKYLFMGRNVEMTLIPETEEIRDVWFERIRARIAPWKLLKERLKALVNHAPGAKLGGNIGNMVIGNPVPAGTNSTQPKWEEIMSSVSEQMRNLEMVDELVAHGTATVETGATFVKLVETAECVMNAAEFVGDVAKCVAGASSVFQLVVLSAQVVAMNAEAKRGRRVLSLAFERCIVILRYVLRSLVGIIRHPLEAEPLHEDLMFDVLKEAVETMMTVETKLARERLGQFMYPKVVKHVEATMELLEIKVVNAVMISKTCELGSAMRILKNESNRLSNDELYHKPPAISPFFVGRTKELGKLEKILEQHRSAAITQQGGAGKTKLIIAFVERAKRKKQSSGGVSWVVVDGEEAQVIEALARLHKNLNGKVIGKKERKNPNIVVERLKHALAKRVSRLQLFLDNAGSRSINRLLSVVCGTTVSPEKPKDGWILATTARAIEGMGQYERRSEIMTGLFGRRRCNDCAWRRVRAIRTDETDETDIKMDEIGKREGRDSNEYSELKQLCCRNPAYSLGRLPFALVHGGTFIGNYSPRN